MAVRFNAQVNLFEFKVLELEPESPALAQIRDRGYADKYRGEGVPTHLIGIECSRERRGLAGFEVESLAASKLTDLYDSRDLSEYSSFPLNRQRREPLAGH